MQKKPEKLRNGYKDKKYMEQLHNFPCIVCDKKNLTQKSRTEAHHLIGLGGGKKASDFLAFPLCSAHHDGRIAGTSIHSTPLKKWEREFGEQKNHILETHAALGVTIYKDYLESLGVEPLGEVEG